MPKRLPNILLLYCDQMQHSRLGFVDGVAHTPYLDALAAEGVHFDHMITQQAQCAPSRACLFTGRSAHECGVMVNKGFFDHQRHLTAEDLTLARQLKSHGYETAYFGKSHLHAPLTELGFDHGGSYDELSYSAEEARNLGCAGLHDSFISDHAATEDALKYLESRSEPVSPLFLTLSLNLPHPPFYADEEFIGKFPLEKMALPESYYRETFRGKPRYQQEHAEDGMHSAGDEAQQKEMTAQYYSMIARADALFGRVIEHFKAHDQWDNALVLFLSDHGDMMGAHKMVVKGTLPYDELYRVPCIFKLPAAGAQSRRAVVDDLLSSQGIAGTLLELAGLDVPACFTGGSFADAFWRDARPADEIVFFEHYAAYWGIHPFYGCRTRKRKYVRYYGDDLAEEFYDLESDPDELLNLAGDPNYALEKEALAAQADGWWQRTGGRNAAYYASEDFKSGLLAP